MKSRKRSIVFVCLFLLSAALFARDIEIYVEDEELGLPLEGAVVSLRNGRQYVCDEDGIALFSIADERQQVVQITYPGYDTRRVSIPAGTDSDDVVRITAALRLSGVMQGRELIVEAQRPETSETKSGRSVAVSERELAQTAEIGLIEDVMSSVKLLPGVGYTGMFGAMPSIRGGDPGDLMASFDGFYLERPYHWVGAVSIFDPKMVSSARLSHGVFSVRYGHTVSGLLEIASKTPDPTEVELETGISTSAVSLNLSYPLGGKGGILFMGKVTYWDIYLGLLKGLSQVTDDENLDMINAVHTAPYIRSAAVAANYRFTPDLDWRLNAFFGSDGVGAASTVEYDGDGMNEGIDGSVRFDAVYDNYQGFLISGINASPSPVLAIKANGGFGFMRTVTDDSVNNKVTVKYNKDFLDKYGVLIAGVEGTPKDKFTSPNVNVEAGADHTILNAQLRGDLDWDLGKGFIAAFGVQELYSYWMQDQSFNMTAEFKLAELDQSYFDRMPPEMAGMAGFINSPYFDFIVGMYPELAIMLPMSFESELRTHGFSTSAYALLEYTSPGQRVGAELGLRMDHLYLLGKNFAAQTDPAFNPRLNIDFNILKNKGILDSLDLTLGTGLFSSINNLVSFIDKDRVNIDGNLKFNRAWTSIAGLKMDFDQGFIFNIEGYYKYIFDRAYINADVFTSPEIKADFHFDGIGHVGGFDLQLQKLESRYVDGWISYTFTWANYKDPYAGGEGVNQGTIDGTSGWYYPSFHRFHNCNLVLNVKPVERINIATRFGFASGQMRERTLYEKDINSYPVIFVNEDGTPEIHQKYEREPLKDSTGKIKTVKERMPWSLPLDVKFSFLIFNRKGKVTAEIYLAGENLLWFYRPEIEGNTRFNSYTGKEDDTGSSASGSMFDFPVPMISFGFKWKY